MATALKLRSDIKKLKKALESKGISASIKTKLKSQLDKAETELGSIQKTGKSPKKSSTTKTKTVLSAVQKLANRKRYSVYKGAGVDLKKDAEVGAMPIGKRISKGLKSNQFGNKGSNKGNVYYEYRANRLDVKQPKKKQTYPKLEDGGIMADEKIRFDMYGYKNVEDRVQDGDVIIRVNSYKEAEDKAKQYLNEKGYQLVELYRGRSFYGSVRKEQEFVKSSRYKEKEEYMADGGMMAKGGAFNEIVDAIFYSNQKKNKIDTSFGIKTKEGLSNMIDNDSYSSKEIAESIFSENEKNGKINTSFGSKTIIGLTEMINNARGGTMADGGMMAMGGMLQHGFRDGDNILEIYKGYGIVENNNNGVIEVLNSNNGSRFIIDLDDSKSSGMRTSMGMSKSEQIESAKRYIDYLDEKSEDGGMMADGGETEQKPMSYYKYETPKVRIYWKGNVQPLGMFKSAEEAYEVIKKQFAEAKNLGFAGKMSDYEIHTPDKIIKLEDGGITAHSGYLIRNLGGDRFDGGLAYEITKDGKVVQEGLIDGEMPVEFEGKSYDGLLALSEGIGAKMEFAKMADDYYAAGGEVILMEDYYGKSARVPLGFDVFTVEWQGDRPLKDNVVISDNGFRTVDKNSALFSQVYLTLLKAMKENKVKVMKDGGYMAHGGQIKAGQYVIVDNPYWKAAMGVEKPVRRRVKMVDGDNVFFSDGSNSSIQYVKKLEDGGFLPDGGILSNKHKLA
jgi:hypothetical protein